MTDQPELPTAQLEQLLGLIQARRWVALTGAGFSTDSGIPDYRGPDSPPANPMLYADFIGSPSNRRRYWVRSFHGWPRMGTALPNAGHQALMELGRRTALVGVLTQNVDALHTAAGSSDVLELHGRLADVRCLGCHTLVDRDEYQRWLAQANPDLANLDVAAGEAELRPDGDLDLGRAVSDQADLLAVPDCPHCSGVMKPDVVFFGESVPRARVDRARAMVASAELLVVLGSSLTVMSGLRFVREHAKRGLPVVIVNRGPTRGDELATIRLNAGTSEVTCALLQRLQREAR